MTDKVNFGSNENLSEGKYKPYKAQDNFHSQFQVNLNSYIDNNNFFRINEVKDKYNRWNPFQMLEYRYIDIISNPRWTGLQAIVEFNISRDNGKTYAVEKNQIIFGAYFFLSDEIIHFNRKLFNVVDLLADIGGLLGGIFAVMRLVIRYVNVQFIMGKFIRNLYYLDLPETKTLKMFGTEMNVTKLKQIKFNWVIKMIELRMLFCKPCRKHCKRFSWI